VQDVEVALDDSADVTDLSLIVDDAYRLRVRLVVKLVWTLDCRSELPENVTQFLNRDQSSALS